MERKLKTKLFTVTTVKEALLLCTSLGINAAEADIRRYKCVKKDNILIMIEDD